MACRARGGGTGLMQSRSLATEARRHGGLRGQRSFYRRDRRDRRDHRGKRSTPLLAHTISRGESVLFFVVNNTKEKTRESWSARMAHECGVRNSAVSAMSAISVLKSACPAVLRASVPRSEERRVGKEWRSRVWRYH